MKHTIVLAGATGNLGGKIAKALIEKDALVRAVVRPGTDAKKLLQLETIGVKVYEVDMLRVDDVAAVCMGASCVVSALAGLREVIIDTQQVLLDAAIKAGVPRFIPSDYSIDFTPFNDGENRNLDWRRAFHAILDRAPIAATSIFNGAFMELLTNEMPLILVKQKMVLYWGKADHRMSFTTIPDTAAYTACAALDSYTPRYLHISGDRVSAAEIRELASELTASRFKLFQAGGAGLLSFLIRIGRRIAPGKNELYPAWQGMQYMRNMIDGRSDLTPADTDNYRYGDLKFTGVRGLLRMHFEQTKVPV